MTMTDDIEKAAAAEAVPAADYVAVPSSGAAARPMLEVVAPATLAEGYTFDAEVNGKTFAVKVPMGGVTAGQRFSVPFPEGSDGYSGAAIPTSSIPVGGWRDGICDCFQLGVCHPTLWNSWCCPLILAGQVMHRLKLTWFGNPAAAEQTSATFHILLRITVAYFFVTELLKWLPVEYFDEYGQLTTAGLAVMYTRDILNLLFTFFTVVVVYKTRKHIREKYSIPEAQCAGCEDCCCAAFCTCCAVAQMARHTADYDTYPALCCSETGLGPHAPAIV
ncbi:hypothetical protein ACHAWF_012144 [Thalassiosira exigua]